MDVWKKNAVRFIFLKKVLYICSVIHFIRISVIKRINDMMMKSRNRKLVNLVFSKHQTKATHTDVYGTYDAKRAGGEIAFGDFYFCLQNVSNFLEMCKITHDNFLEMCKKHSLNSSEMWKMFKIEAQSSLVIDW